MKVDIEAFEQGLSGKSLDEVVAIAVSLFQENIQVKNKLKEFIRSSSEMALQFQQMKDELDGAKKELEILREQNIHLTGVNTLRNRSLFGRGTEKTADILDRGVQGEDDKDPLSEDLSGDPEPGQGSCPGKGSRKGSLPEKKKGTGRKKKDKGKREEDIRSLPRRVFFDYDIENLDRTYGEGNWRFAFWEKHLSVETVRPMTYLQVTYTPVISSGLDHQLSRIPFVQVFPKSLASASLLASIMIDKYALFLPLYRQEHDEGRFGFPVSRKTMSNWISYACNELLEPVYRYLCSVLMGTVYHQCDETTYTVIRDGRKAGTKSYIWTHRTSELSDGPEIIVYCYEKTRHTDHLREFYAGLDHEIYLTCDAYGAYSCFAGETDGLVKICGCFMHARRRFVDALAVRDIKGLSEKEVHRLPEMKGIDLIAEIYREDGSMKGDTAEARLENRQVNVKPKVEAFFEFIENFDLDDPSSSEKLCDAIQYSKKQKKSLVRFLEDGNIPLDDGATERNIRTIAQGRRNYLFSYTVRGAYATVIASTLIATARANGADPYYYIKYLLEQMVLHLNYNGKTNMPDMMPWSKAYTSYEAEQKQMILKRAAPPGNEKPQTPRKTPKKKAG